MTLPESTTLAKVEVLADLEEVVHQLMITHEWSGSGERKVISQG